MSHYVLIRKLDDVTVWQDDSGYLAALDDKPTEVSNPH